jgi:hypothetical protein
MLQVAGFVQISHTAVNAGDVAATPGKYAWTLFTGRKP